jgi:hypothetical protein
MKYLITGLPRSRTLWMSKFLPDCIHEVAHKIRSLEELRNYDCGIADHGLGFFLDWIIPNLNVPIVVIDRDIREVEDSLMGMGLGLPLTNFCEILQMKLEERGLDKHVLWIPFEELNDRMEEICKHIGVHFDAPRFEEMSKQKIEIDIDEIRAELARIPENNLIHKEVVPLLKIRRTLNV